MGELYTEARVTVTCGRGAFTCGLKATGERLRGLGREAVGETPLSDVNVGQPSSHFTQMNPLKRPTCGDFGIAPW